MIVQSPLVFVFGVVIGVFAAIFLIEFVREKRIFELFTDRQYYAIFSRKKNNLRKIIEYLEKEKRATKEDFYKLLKTSRIAVDEYLEELKKDKLIVQKKRLKNIYFVLKR